MAKVLHLLAQRPSLTGSGVTLDTIVRHALDAGWDQRVVVGVPADDPHPDVGGLDSVHVRPLVFGRGELDFPVPGMSDVMPYPSTRFADLSGERLEAYRAAWRRHVEAQIADFRPDVIHSHHVWILSAMLKDVAPNVPITTRCHATGLRQMSLCPHLAREVKEGCARNDRFFVLHQGHARALADTLGISGERIHVVGAGYREDLFHARGRDPDAGSRILYIGKLSRAKGLPWLLDAVERLAERKRDVALHVAGSGAGPEAEALQRRMEAMAPRVKLHGHLAQAELSDLMRRSHACVLPSFYEGLPLVLVEALASGCRLVATELPGVMDQLAPRLDEALELVPLPRLEHVDKPRQEDLPAFVERLASSMERVLDKPALGDPGLLFPEALEYFSWRAVFKRVEAVWREIIP